MLHLTKSTLTLTSLIVLLGLPTGVSYAQVSPPNAGDTLRNIQRQPNQVPQRSTEPLVTEEKADTGESTTATKIFVKEVRITGNTLFKTEELHELVADIEGHSHTLSALEKAASRITTFYRENGYMVSRAYIPPQKMEGGVLTFAIVEGALSEKRVDNKSLLSDRRAERYVDSQIDAGNAIESSSVDRALLLLADTPGVSNAQATLRPGASVGTSDLIVTVDKSQYIVGNLAADNYGNRYTGQYRLDGSVTVSSPLEIGDQITLRGLFSNEDLSYGRVSYSLPVGYDGLRVGVAYASSWYGLGKEFSSLDAGGRAENTSLYATYPVIRSLKGSLYSSVTLEDKRLQDRTGSPYSASDRDLQMVSVGLAGNYQDTLLGGGVTAFEVMGTKGVLGMDDASATIDSGTAKARGDYGRLTYSLSRLQRLTDNNFAFARVSGQEASRNLNSSEKMSLGGSGGVRAYPQGESDGDEGQIGTVELQHNFASSEYVPFLQGVVFYDIGSIKENESDYNPSDNHRTISGAGLGVNATTIGDVNVTASVAWRMTGGDPQSDSKDKVPRFWFRVSKQF